jgi:hypothetical protein
MSGDTEGCKPDEPSTNRTILIKDLHTLFKALGEADGEVSDYSIPSTKVHSAIYPFELKITPKNILGPENDKLPLAHIIHHITHLTSSRWRLCHHLARSRSSTPPRSSGLGWIPRQWLLRSYSPNSCDLRRKSWETRVGLVRLKLDTTIIPLRNSSTWHH